MHFLQFYECKNDCTADKYAALMLQNKRQGSAVPAFAMAKAVPN